MSMHSQDKCENCGTEHNSDKFNHCTECELFIADCCAEYDYDLSEGEDPKYVLCQWNCTDTQACAKRKQKLESPPAQVSDTHSNLEHIPKDYQ